MSRPTLLSLLCVLVLHARGADPATPVETVALHNVFRVGADLYSGSGPDSEAAFRELARLGVKTMVSVDGAKPHLDLARKFQMRYVHLPIGYDGLPQARGEELARAVQSADGSVFIHCHHGKHRGPAAVAVVCRALRGWSAKTADEFLEQAGTSPDYAGLFRDVQAFRPPDAAALAQRPAKFPEYAPAEPLVDAMVAIDEQFDALNAAQKSGWLATRAASVFTPAQRATLMWERYRELLRDPATDKLGADFRRQLTAAAQNAETLRDLLRDSMDRVEVDAAFARVVQNCTDCHEAHRNQRR